MRISVWEILNGDGYADFIVSEPDYGRIFIYNGSPDCTGIMEDAMILEETPNTWFGSSITTNAGPVW